MQITTDALVLKVMDVGENDRLLTLLSKDYGIIRAFASGAKKIQNKYFDFYNDVKIDGRDIEW